MWKHNVSQDEVEIADSEVFVALSFDSIHSSTEKTTPVDADETNINDSEDGWSLKKVTWANIKATLKTYFDTLYVVASKSYISFVAGHAEFTYTGGHTEFFGAFLTRDPEGSEGLAKIFAPVACVIKTATFSWRSSNAISNENISLYIRKNETTDYLIATVGNTDTLKAFYNGALSIALAAGDYFEIKVVCPSWGDPGGGTTIIGTISAEV